MKSLKEILQETAQHEEPPAQSLEIPEWQEPKPTRRWLTVGEVIENGGDLCNRFVDFLLNAYSMVIWGCVAFFLLVGVWKVIFG